MSKTTKFLFTVILFIVAGGFVMGQGKVEFNDGSADDTDHSFRWDDTSKRLGIGTGNTTPALELHIRDTANHLAGIKLESYRDGANVRGYLWMTSAQWNSGLPAAVASGDELGQWLSQGWEGDNYKGGASIRMYCDGTVQNNIVPSRIEFLTNGTSAETRYIRMTIKNNGWVGIGTTDPGESLDVRGGAIFNDYGWNRDFRIEGDNKTHMFFLDASADKIGINCAAPLAMLDVRGDAVFNNDAADKDFKIKGVTDGNLFFVDASADAIGIGSNNIDDGTTVYKLSVLGKVRCEELKVYLSTNWGDYVFEDEYDLRPLQEVETFIEENHHLPEIPKGSELEENGLYVGNMLSLQMKKIEELTLYVIQQQKEIEELKAQMSNR